MSDQAEIVRERMGVCLALHGDRADCPACISHRIGETALDALVAERDDLKHRVEHRLVISTSTNGEDVILAARERAEVAEAEVKRLREELVRFADKIDRIALAALKEQT